jgi:hypothetical protein
MKETRRFNPWPAGIIAALVMFAGGLVMLIVVASSDPMQLVTRDYYAQELRYQDRIDELNRTKALANPVQIRWDRERRQIALLLPPDHARERPEGRVHLYRPSAAELDRHFPLATDGAGIQRIDGTVLQPGLWRVRVEWAVAGQRYLVEESVTVAAGS